MSASSIDATKYTNVAANTVFDAVLDATAILAWYENIRTVVNQHATEIDLKANKIQEAWIAPTLQNAWVNYGGTYSVASYMKDELGFVHIKGFIKNGTATAGTAIFELPVGYRPLAILPFSTMSNNGGVATPCAIDVFNDGGVAVGVFAAGASWISLNLPPFRAEQ